MGSILTLCSVMLSVQQAHFTQYNLLCALLGTWIWAWIDIDFYQNYVPCAMHAIVCTPTRGNIAFLGEEKYNKIFPVNEFICLEKLK